MELIFLGTGPVGGTVAKGRSGRSESSALVKTRAANILIDVTNFFEQQAKLIESIDAILITHAHRDAIGGLSHVTRWPITIFSLGQTIRKLKQKFKNLKYQFVPIRSGKIFKIGNVFIKPFLVKHSIQPGFPTLGFHFSGDGKKLVYVSDVASWDKKAEKLMKDCDVLVIDGAMWGKKMAAHLDIKEILPKICQWPVKKIIFTQIGRSVPQHEILQKEIKRICPKAQPAYDGMKLEI